MLKWIWQSYAKQNLIEMARSGMEWDAFSERGEEKRERKGKGKKRAKSKEEKVLQL